MNRRTWFLFTKQERESAVEEWTLVFRIFILGFCGVFVTLAILMVSILISGAVIRTFKVDG